MLGPVELQSSLQTLPTATSCLCYYACTLHIFQHSKHSFSKSNNHFHSCFSFTPTCPPPKAMLVHFRTLVYNDVGIFLRLGRLPIRLHDGPAAQQQDNDTAQLKTRCPLPRAHHKARHGWQDKQMRPVFIAQRTKDKEIVQSETKAHACNPRLTRHSWL